MRKVYTFKQLREKAKKKAAEEVYRKEEHCDFDVEVESKRITEVLHEHLHESMMEFENTPWSFDYHIDLDLSSVKITDELLQKILTKKELENLGLLNEITDGYMEHKLFDKSYNIKGYELELNYIFYEDEAIAFLRKYSKDADIRDMYKFHALLGGELSSEDSSELRSQIESHLEEIRKPIKDKLNEYAERLQERLVKIISDSWEYFESEQYWYDSLEDESYPHEKYLFNYKGEIILEDCEYVEDEYEHIYMNSVA